MRRAIFAKQMLTAAGWRQDVHVIIGEDGRITALGDGDVPDATRVDILLPAPGNEHSHSFQRALAGLTEFRGKAGTDNFWSWRELMYRFVERLTPEHVEAIAAQVQVEMLEAGYAAVGEFHYLHHQNGGEPYDDPAEMSGRILNAAAETGIGCTHLPVLYMRGGLDDRALKDGQLRFGCDPERFERLHEAIRGKMNELPDDFRIGVAPHSLRAVTQEGLALAAVLAKDAPVHIHIAEQTAEVDEVKAALGSTPVRWLLDHAEIAENWCLIHATHMSPDEIRDAAVSKSVAGLCPITEANLGDGVFSAATFIDAGGRMAVGSDSNVRISLTEELRLLEYSQRLTLRRRAVLADARSCGRFLYDHVTAGGAQALGRDSGRIEPGALADLVALDGAKPYLAGMEYDHLLDAWIFAGDDGAVTDVWSAGRHVVRGGEHIRRDAVRTRFDAVMAELRADL